MLSHTYTHLENRILLADGRPPQGFYLIPHSLTDDESRALFDRLLELRTSDAKGFTADIGAEAIDTGSGQAPDPEDNLKGTPAPLRAPERDAASTDKVKAANVTEGDLQTRHSNDSDPRGRELAYLTLPFDLLEMKTIMEFCGGFRNDPVRSQTPFLSKKVDVSTDSCSCS